MGLKKCFVNVILFYFLAEKRRAGQAKETRRRGRAATDEGRTEGEGEIKQPHGKGKRK